MEEKRKLDPRIKVCYNIIKTYYCSWLLISLYEYIHALTYLLEDQDHIEYYLGMGAFLLTPLIFAPIFTLEAILIHYFRILRGAISCWRYIIILTIISIIINSVVLFGNYKIIDSEFGTIIFSFIAFAICAFIINLIRIMINRLIQKYNIHIPQISKIHKRIMIFVIMLIMQVSLFVMIMWAQSINAEHYKNLYNESYSEVISSNTSI